MHSATVKPLKERKAAITHKLDGETSMFLSVFFDPYILKVAKSSLVRIVLNLECKSAVVHHGYWPKIRDRLDDLSALFVHGA